MINFTPLEFYPVWILLGVKSGHCNGTPKKGWLKIVIFQATFSILLKWLMWMFSFSFLWTIEVMENKLIAINITSLTHTELICFKRLGNDWIKIFQWEKFGSVLVKKLTINLLFVSTYFFEVFFSIWKPFDWLFSWKCFKNFLFKCLTSLSKSFRSSSTIVKLSGSPEVNITSFWAAWLSSVRNPFDLFWNRVVAAP